MLVTTNELTQEQLNNAATLPHPQVPTFSELCEKRVLVEQRGDPDEYDALADEFLAIGAITNAQSLHMKAVGMRRESVRFWEVES